MHRSLPSLVSLAILFPTVLGTPAVTAASSTVTGLAASAPTNPASRQVGQLPALGWNDWNAYGCNVNATLIENTANQFISLGLKDAGYEYVNIDDCWAEKNRTNGKLVPDPTKFPDGISAVADTVHGLGLKIGIYSDAGTNTCAGYPGSLGNEEVDAATWSEWGIDYLKYDNCNVPANWTDVSPPPADLYNSNSAIRYRQMGGALANKTRPFQFSLCIWGDDEVWEWGPRVGHSWRIFSDANASWNYITSVINQNVQHLSSVNFFSHNDMDMLEIGNGGLTIEEQRTHFAVWAFLKSPIILGTNLANLNSTQLAIIKNAELLAFSQDTTVGTPAMPFTPKGASATSPPEFYSGKSAKGTHVFVVNTGNNTAEMTFDFASVSGLSGTSFDVHDMWASKDLGTFSGSYSVELASHDTAAFRITSA